MISRSFFSCIEQLIVYETMSEEKNKEVQIRLVTQLDIDLVFDLVSPDGAGFQVAGEANRRYRCKKCRRTLINYHIFVNIK